MNKNNVLVGFFKTEITPEKLGPLSGFAGTRQATGVHDALYAHAMVVQTQDNRYAMVMLDLLSVSEELVSLVREEGEKLGFAKENLQLIATHTHSAPVGINDTNLGLMQGMDYFLGHRDAGYIRFVAKQVLTAIEEAIANLHSQTLRIGKTAVEGISSNRSRPESKYDNILLAFEFTADTGEKNLLIRFACHPTVLNAANTLISGDFPAALYRRFADRYAHVLFLNGACGDISTRFTRHSADFQEIERMGEVLETAVHTALAAPVYQGAFDHFSLYQKHFVIHTKTPGNLEELTKRCEEAEEGLGKISLQADLEYAKYQQEKILGLEANRAAIQNMTLIFLPVEIYSSLVLPDLREDIYYTGCANGYYTYLTDSAAYTNSEYEAHMTPFAKGEGERIIKEIQNWNQSIQ